MAKDSPSATAPNQKPFRKFETLVRKLVRVPKEKIQQQRSKGRRPSSG